MVLRDWSSDVCSSDLCGDEAIWWGEVRIDATAAARVLWLKTHPLPATMEKIEDGAISKGSPYLTNAVSDPPGGKSSKISETKPITADGA
jgi:hypothetical protein